MPLPIAGRGPRPARGPVTHTFLVGPDQPLRALQITTPAGFEDFAAEVGQPTAELACPDPGPIDPTALGHAATTGWKAQSTGRTARTR